MLKGKQLLSNFTLFIKAAKLTNLSYLLNLISWNKLKNIFLIIVSFYFSKVFRIYKVFGKPYAITIEPSGLCNLNCPECPVGAATLTRSQINMSIANFKMIVDDIESHTLILQLFFQGEPFINKSIIEMIRYANQKKMFTVISTNGLNLDNPEFAREIANSNLGQLIISMDGASEETYSIYRQSGNFKKLRKGIELICKEKKKMNKLFPIIDLQFIVMKHNEHEINHIRELGSKLGVDRVIFKSPQIYNFDNAENFLPTNEKYRRYYKSNGSFKLKGSYDGYCQKLWIGSVITADSQVLPCCFDKDAKYSFGCLDDKNYGKIWNENQNHNFRKAVIKGRDQMDICKNCTEGLKIFSK